MRPVRFPEAGWRLGKRLWALVGFTPDQHRKKRENILIKTSRQGLKALAAFILTVFIVADIVSLGNHLCVVGARDYAKSGGFFQEWPEIAETVHDG